MAVAAPAPAPQASEAVVVVAGELQLEEVETANTTLEDKITLHTGHTLHQGSRQR